MSKVLSIRVSGEEYKKLQIRAIKKDMNVTEYMRYILLREHKKDHLISPPEAQEEG